MEKDEMTTLEFKTLIEMVILILEKSKTKEEALENLKNLLLTAPGLIKIIAGRKEAVKMPYTQARNRATQKYVKEHCERVYITLPNGIKESWKAAADAAGESLTAYIVKAVEMRIEKEAEA